MGLVVKGRGDRWDRELRNGLGMVMFKGHFCLKGQYGGNSEQYSIGVPPFKNEGVVAVLRLCQKVLMASDCMAEQKLL